MDKKAVAIINPRIIVLTLVPTVFMICKAILLCKFHFSIAIAMIKRNLLETFQVSQAIALKIVHFVATVKNK
jgi:hypothetical protein